MNFVFVVGLVFAVLFWVARNTKVRKDAKVRVPLTAEERLMRYDQVKPSGEQLLARQAAGLKVIEQVVLREYPIGELGALAHRVRDAERAAREAVRARRPGKLRLIKPTPAREHPEAHRASRGR